MKRMTKVLQVFAITLAFFATKMSVQAANTSGEVDALRSAHKALAGANHNYKNHRFLAMQAIAQACSLLGANIGGDGKGGELQIISDIQLHQAQFTLQMARMGIPKGQQPQVAALMDTAIKQIGLALAGK